MATAVEKTGQHGKPTLSVSLVLYRNSVAWLRQTLISLVAAVDRLQQVVVDARVSLVIVDNSGHPPYRAQVEALLARLETGDRVDVEYVCAPRNEGFAVGHNRAIEESTSRYHLVLNPDVNMDSEVLLLGYRYLESHRDAVLVSPRVIDPEGRQQFLCKAYPTVAVLLLRGFAPVALARRFSKVLDAYELRELCRRNEVVDIPLASGCFMLVRTDALRSAGGFCERFFLYFEDFDLSLRLKAHGRLMYLPAMHIVHHGGNASRKGLRHIRLFITSGIRFFNRNGWRWI